MLKSASLADWLRRLEQLHPTEIELGLERVSAVAERMGDIRPAPLLITVGGTNGKGSCVAMLESILSAAGLRTAAYTSPHLLRYNERVRINGAEASDAALISAFEQVEKARQGTSLTYFEFGTLAAFDCMRRENPDVALLEVGLGGRLDAVNCLAADVAVVASIGTDHADWLGSGREAVGAEKAGIFRSGRPAVCGDADPPDSLLQHAADCGALLAVAGRDFHVRSAADSWSYQGPHASYEALPMPGLAGSIQLHNAAAVLTALGALADRLPVGRNAIDAGLRAVRLPGRLQRIPGAVEHVLDVAHNRESAQALADWLAGEPPAGRTLAVFGLLNDKDAAAMAAILGEYVNEWIVVTLPPPRGRCAAELAVTVRAAGGIVSACADDVRAALITAASAAQPGDRILVCGSFQMVAPALQHLSAILAPVHERRGN